MTDVTIVMEQYTIYDHPADHPEVYVVRKWGVRIGSREPVDLGVVTLTETLDAARQSLPEGLVCLARSEQDDPVIVETWI